MNDLSRERRLLQILEDVADLPPSQRDAFLDKACGGDRHLREKAERLLRRSDEPFTEVLGVGGTKPSSFSEGSDVGPFTLMEKLGAGGMGVVYLAFDGRSNQNVAVKFIRFGRFATAMERYRFDVEQKSLSHLAHPNIVTIFDAGILGGTQPYFAMEYIRGTSLTSYCDNAHLSVRKRLKLVIQIARAVHYAHQKMIVHRDLKPANILVQRNGTPRLLDFGIAKLLDDPGGLTTATGMRMMTLEYAAPEQIKGDAITPAIDVYALGVVLYELLTGRRPFNSTDGSKGELLQSILNETPINPSEAVLQADRLLPNISETTAHRSSQLQGDLDAIILKTLQKDPADRYGSAQQLADALIHYVEKYPDEH